MRYCLITFLALASSAVFAQTNVVRKALASNIKVPIPIGWEKVDDNLSLSIRTGGTYNIISMYKGDISENLITLYGDSVISKKILPDSYIEAIRDGIEKKTLPQLAKLSMTDIPMEKVLSILKKFYKDEPEKMELLEKNRPLLFSKGKVTTEPPRLIRLQSNGFYYLLPVMVSIDNASYSFSLILGHIRLQKYSYGISGSVTNAAENELNVFIKKLLLENPS